MAILMRDKERAKQAYDTVRKVAELNKPAINQRYRTQARSGSAMIQRNGLGHYLAFLASRGFSGQTLVADGSADHADGLMYQHLGSWLVVALGLQPNYPKVETVVPGAGPNTDPLDFLLDTQCHLEQTLMATREALAYLQWTRRFTESLLPKPKKEERQG